ncbi:MAG: hypothetical protein CMJ18_00045 [Phycisphaeraceae bacterium]|nr:hypothetical protein [Phycisphaeraceae bacterium]
MSCASREPFEVGLDRQSFVKGELVAHTAGCVRRIAPPIKREKTVLAPSERAGDAFRLGQVRWDPQQQRFLLWMLCESTSGATVLRYATGSDGIRWDLADSGIAVVDTNGEPVCPKCAIFLNPRANDGDRRFVAIFQKWHYYYGHSADGIRWQIDMDRPVWERGSGDSLGETMSFMFDPARDVWRAYVRIWVDNSTRRAIGHGESPDLRSWSGPRIIYEADDRFGFGAQVYSMSAWLEGGMYWGIANIYFSDLHPKRRMQQTMQPWLMHSDDGLKWEPVDTDAPFIPLGTFGTWDGGMIGCGAPVIQDGRALFYYSGYPEPHGCARLANAAAQRGAMGLAIGRPGAYAGMNSLSGEEGVLITRPFRLEGDQVAVSATTRRGGCVKAELIDPGGSIVPSLEIDRDCDPLTGDADDALMSWRGSTTAPGRVTGEHVRLRLRWEDATVHGFRIRQSTPEVARVATGPGPMRCGATTRPPVIDGRLDDDVWQDFSVLGVADAFTWYDRTDTAPVATTVYVTYDDTALYFGLHLDEPHVEKLVDDCRAIDGQRTLLTDDAVQIELQPHGVEGPATMVLFNCRGACGTITSDPKKSHDFQPGDPPGLEVATSISQGCWEAEIRLPFEILMVAPPAPGDRWPFNVHRFRRAGQKSRAIYSWVCTYGELLRHDRRGELRF